VRALGHRPISLAAPVPLQISSRCANSTVQNASKKQSRGRTGPSVLRIGGGQPTAAASVEASGTQPGKAVGIERALPGM